MAALHGKASKEPEVHLEQMVSLMRGQTSIPGLVHQRLPLVGGCHPSSQRENQRNQRRAACPVPPPLTSTRRQLVHALHPWVLEITVLLLSSCLSWLTWQVPSVWMSRWWRMVIIIIVHSSSNTSSIKLLADISTKLLSITTTLEWKDRAPMVQVYMGQQAWGCCVTTHPCRPFRRTNQPVSLEPCEHTQALMPFRVC